MEAFGTVSMNMTYCYQVKQADVGLQNRAMSERKGTNEEQDVFSNKVRRRITATITVLKNIGNRLQVPVVRLISIALILWPKTLNWGRDTSLETPTDLGPSFHLYRISLMVYPTVRVCVDHHRHRT